MLKYLIVCVLGLLAIAGKTFTTKDSPDSDITNQTISYFNTEALQFSQAANELYLATQLIDSINPRSLENARNSLAKTRIQYKRISFFLDYFLPHQAWIYNAPSKFEVEEPFMEYEEPHGFQHMEEILFTTRPAREKKRLEEEARVIKESAFDIKSLLYQLPVSDAQIMESLSVELIRIMYLYIGGYDAPHLKTGLKESREALQSMLYIASLYGKQKSGDNSKLIALFQHCIDYLQSHQDFDYFNRLVFLTDYAIPLGKALDHFIEGRGFAVEPDRTVTQCTPLLFGKKKISVAGSSDSDIASLGEKLFYDKRLSGDFSRSCASCHQPAKYFTDGLARNLTFDRKAELDRNIPTLLYAGFQTSQFWDGRARDLHEQVLDVLTNPREMNGNIKEIEARINKDEYYTKMFQNTFGITPDSSITIDQITAALANFVDKLAPRNSNFDLYMGGNKKALTPGQQKGFNLFMGKGQCGTCHFMPLFNGLTPPYFNKSEYEVLGVTKTDQFHTPGPDGDSGRFSYFPASFYKGAFKTPTLRNIAMTGPYMHNGRFRSLSKVLEFYNLGGGVGLGMHVANQTLSSKPLHLTKSEMAAIILFLDALTDRLPATVINSGEQTRSANHESIARK